jgi:release factor glutamine methyltransferase
MEKEMSWLLKEKYGGEKSEAFFADCKRLALGEPLGYLIGHVPFLGCTIYLDSRPLVPRVETEYWTEKAIEEMQRNQELRPDLGLTEARVPLRVLDVCAGSGCIGVAIAKEVENTLVDFSELEQKHLPTIEKNVVANGIELKCVRIKQSNLFSAYEDIKYDFIVSNPPYIDSDKHQADQNVIDFEPHTALFGGRGGIEVIEQLIAAAPAHLRPLGQLWIEHDPEQSTTVQELANKHNFVATTHKDQYGVERYSVLVLQ